MRVLLDEQLPRNLARELPEHEVHTVQQRGWSGLTNGELLERAAIDRFEIFVAADHSLQYQQNLSHLEIGIIVLIAPSNALEDLRPLIPDLLSAITITYAGQVTRLTTRPSLKKPI